MTVPPEQEASYSAIIDEILASSDLNTISAKRIRKGLQEKVSYDISHQKQAITDLIMARFDKAQQKQSQTNGEAAGTAADEDEDPPAPEPAPTAKTNGLALPPHPQKVESEEEEEPSEPVSPTKRKVSDDEDLSDVVDSPPPKKSKKVSKSVAETDEELAKRMQAELNAPSRSTRNAGTTKRKPVAKRSTKATPKKKSKAKINSDDDSNVSDSGEKPEKEKKGGFHKPMILSQPLSEMLGESQLSRPQTVKKIWAYVKERDLQDPNDKRQIRCDDAMRAVFKQERVHMFTMNKLLASHLYAADE